MPVVILTGYSGLLGSALVKLLIPAFEIVCVGRTQLAAVTGISHIEADLAVPGFAARLPVRADAIIHLAQSADFNAFPNHASRVFNTNVAAVSELLEWGLKSGIANFVHASTGGLYGTGSAPFKETDPVRLEGPLANYFTTKYCAELLAASYSKYFNVVALRYFFIYGAAQKRNMLMPRLIDSVRGGRPITLTGHSGLKMNPIHVSDAANATAAALTKKVSGIYNVGGNETLSLRELAGIIGRAAGETPSFEINAGPEHIDVVGNIDNMRADLAQPSTLFADGIAEMCLDKP